MSHCHHITEQARHILCYLAKKWNIGVDVDTGAALNPEGHERVIKPFADNLNASVPTMIVEDSIFGFGTGKDVEETTSRRVGKAAENMEDPRMKQASYGH
ncbi:hypothetical protein IWW34DRAFT_810127 [Fusarium oxysporum f. sp. albedinis]|nr:hypothetical protein IWW34DRAFT_810127 [Fusarium oxysporum f. sp. albedinis]